MWIELGRLGAPYGLRGWIHVESYTDPPQRLADYGQWVLRLAGGERMTRRVAEARSHGKGLVARLDGVAGRDEAAALTGAAIEVERAALPQLGEREYYRVDLIGFRVRNLQGADLGVLSHFVDAPSGALLVSREAAGQQHWIPAAPPHLQRVDLAAREVVVDWPAALE